MGQKEGQAEPLMAHLAERGLGVRHRQLPPVAAGDVARPHRRRQAGAGVDEGDHRRARRRSRLRGDHRRLGRRAPVVARRAHAPRRRLPARASRTPTPPWRPPCRSTACTTSSTATAPAGPTWRASWPSGCSSRRWPRTALAGSRRPPSATSGPHAPPFFVLHGTNDSLVPVGQARTFVDELRKESNRPVVYAELPGAQHAFEMLPVRAARTRPCTPSSASSPWSAASTAAPRRPRRWVRRRDPAADRGPPRSSLGCDPHGHQPPEPRRVRPLRRRHQRRPLPHVPAAPGRGADLLQRAVRRVGPVPPRRRREGARQTGRPSPTRGATSSRSSSRAWTCRRAWCSSRTRRCTPCTAA